MQDLAAAVHSSDPAEREAATAELRRQVTPYVRRTRRRDLPLARGPRLELQLPVLLSLMQAECYRMILARQYEQLGNHKAQRHSGQRASMLRGLCADVCRVRLVCVCLPCLLHLSRMRTVLTHVSASPIAHAAQPLRCVYLPCFLRSPRSKECAIAIRSSGPFGSDLSAVPAGWFLLHILSANVYRVRALCLHAGSKHCAECPHVGIG